MTQALRHLFFLFIVRPIVLVALGINTRHRERLPTTGPAILIANHNSHLDTMVLLTLFPLRLLPRIHPVAASDYFLRNALLSWFSLNIIGIVPIFLHGLGKVLPKGEALLIPFFCDVFVGETLQWRGDKNTFMHDLEVSMKTRAGEGHFSPWE